MATEVFAPEFFLNPFPVLRNSPRLDDLAAVSADRLGTTLIVVGRAAMHVAPLSGAVDELVRARHGVTNIDDAGLCSHLFPFMVRSTGLEPVSPGPQPNGLPC